LIENVDVMNRYLLSILILIYIGCSTDPTDLGQEIQGAQQSPYMPLSIGHTLDYQVMEIIYRSEGLIIDTLAFQLREEVSSTFVNTQGNLIYNIDRFTRSGPSEDWSYIQTWQSTIRDQQIIRTEENLSFIKLRLPIRANDTWDGNALFDSNITIEIGNEDIDYFKNWSSQLISTGGQVEVDGEVYDDALVVSLADHENRLELRNVQEIYARDLGLVYKEIQILDTQCFDNCDNVPWPDKADRGHIYIQTLLKS